MIVLDDPLLIRIPFPTPAPTAGGPSRRRSRRWSRARRSGAVLKEISRRASQAAEREAISKMLEQTGWNRVRAARALRISYRALLYKIKQAARRGASSGALGL